jgi:hypothetical protein
MKKFLILKAVLLLALPFAAQTTATYLNAKQAQALTDITKTAELCVVIENEKAPLDAALVEAVKAYWKITKVKFMSQLEFGDKMKSRTLDTKNLYLYSTFYYGFGYYSGYYLTNDPVKLSTTKKMSARPPYVYFSVGSAIADSKGNVNKGYFALMIKNFVYEVNYCKNPENFDKKKKKYKTEGNLVFMKDKSEMEGKNLLLVKEQVSKKAKTKESKDSKKSKQKEDTNVPISVKNTDSKIKTVVVFPEDIDYAVKKSDKSVMLYNGGQLYSAEDGSVYVGPKPYNARPSSFYYVYYALSIIAAVVFLVLVNR